MHTALTDPQDPVAAGSATTGGYGYETINNKPYAPGNGKILQTAWTGAKYELASGWSFAGAYYRLSQAAYTAYGSYYTPGPAPGGTKNSGAYTCGQGIVSNNLQKRIGNFAGNTVGATCAGELNQVSFLADYQFNKHFDVYSGISYSEVGGGLSSGFLSSSMTTFVTGARLRF